MVPPPTLATGPQTNHGPPGSLSWPIRNMGRGWRPSSQRAVWWLSLAVWVQWVPVVLMAVMPPSFPCLVAQASCLCKPGLVNVNHNASAGCLAYCFPHSCDRSATCQVTPDGKTRWAQGLWGGHWGQSREGGLGRGKGARVCTLSSRARWGQVGEGQEVGTGRTPCPDRCYPRP